MRPCTLFVRRVVTVMVAGRPSRLLPGLSYEAASADGRAFTVRGIGAFEIPDRDADAFLVIVPPAMA